MKSDNPFANNPETNLKNEIKEKEKELKQLKDSVKEKLKLKEINAEIEKINNEFNPPSPSPLKKIIKIFWR